MGELSNLSGPASPSGGLVAGGVITRVPSFELVGTNVLLQSATFSNASWTKTNVTATANTTAAPNGVTEADTLTDNSAVAIGTTAQNVTIANDGSTWTLSGYFTAGTATQSKLSLTLTGGVAVSATIDFNPVSGTIVAQTGALSPVVEALSIGGVVWFRVSVSVANNTSGNVTAQCVISPDNSSVAGVGSVIAWGAQLENSAAASSQIPTTTVAVTRVAGKIPGYLIDASFPMGGSFTTGTFTGLLDISAAGAGQIKYPATQNPSADANTLDDYEEGTWTPINNQVGITVNSAFYTKTGRNVNLQGDIVMPVTADATGMNIGSVPFVGNTNSYPVTLRSDIGVAIQALFNSSSTNITPFEASVGPVTQTNANYSAKNVRFTVNYNV